MLGEKEETFRGNMFLIFLLVPFAAYPIYIVLAKYETYSAEEFFYGLLVVGSLLASLCWFLIAKITICTEGISSRTMLGTKEMRWEDIVGFTYSFSWGVELKPVIFYWEYYVLRLEDSKGQVIKLRNRVNLMRMLVIQIVKHTLPVLLPKAIEQYNNGAELDFGWIKLDRATGIKSKSMSFSNEVPLDQVTDYIIDEGIFYVFHKKAGYAPISAPVRKVSNALVLLKLLDSLFITPHTDYCDIDLAIKKSLSVRMYSNFRQ